MSYINISGFFKFPEKCWGKPIKENKLNYQISIFQEMERLTFK